MVEGDEREFSRGNTTEVFDGCIPKTTSSNHSLHAKTVDEGIFATPNTKEKLPKNSGNAPRKTANAELAANLRKAAKDGDITELIALLWMSCADKPLVFGALRFGCAVTLQLLLAPGADPNTEFDGQTPLSACIP